MANLPKASYRFSVHSFKIPVQFFKESVSLGHDRATVLISTYQLWLLSEDVHKIKPGNVLP